MTETKKPELRGEHDISRKPLRAGMPGDFGGPVLLVCALPTTFAHEPSGAPCARHSPRPLGRTICITRAKLCRENIEVCLHVIARSTPVRRSPPSGEGGCDEAIHLSACRTMDCFAEPVIGRAFARPVGWQ